MSIIRCPTCHEPFDTERTKAMPFCSERCRDIDLGRWLDEQNSILIQDDSDNADDELVEP